jgi:hypothetical protein
MSESKAKAYIRSKSSTKFLNEEMKWVSSMAQAKAFPSILKAFEFAQSKRLKDTEIILTMGMHEYDVSINGPTFPD